MQFDDPEDGGEAYARNTDPETSHGAADSVKGKEAQRLEKIVLFWLRKYPDGLNTHEIADFSGIGYESISPRMAPMASRGLVHDSGLKRPGPGRRKPCIVWRLGPKPPEPPKEQTK